MFGVVLLMVERLSKCSMLAPLGIVRAASGTPLQARRTDRGLGTLKSRGMDHQLVWKTRLCLRAVTAVRAVASVSSRNPGSEQAGACAGSTGTAARAVRVRTVPDGQTAVS